MRATFRFTVRGDYDPNNSHDLLGSGDGIRLSSLINTNDPIEIGDVGTLLGYPGHINLDYIRYVPGAEFGAAIYALPHYQYARLDLMSFYLDYSISQRKAEFHGGDFGDVLIGGGGQDALFGRGGNDALTGNAGQDFLFGGDGFDTLDFAAEAGPGGVIVNLATSSREVNPGTSRDSYGTVDTFTGIENVRTGGHADRVYGSGEANHISTNAGDDYIHAGAGNDHLNGGSGNDVLKGGTGYDRLHGGVGLDRFVFLHIEDSHPGAHPYDVISDFHSGVDKIDLHALRTAHHQPLRWVDTADLAAGFPGAGVPGQTRYANGHLQVDIDGDGHRDFEVIVHGGHHQPAVISPGDIIFG